MEIYGEAEVCDSTSPDYAERKEAMEAYQVDMADNVALSSESQQLQLCSELSLDDLDLPHHIQYHIRLSLN